jgi:hypothetical protein
MFMRFCELLLSSLKIGNNCSPATIQQLTWNSEEAFTFCEQVKAKTCIGNVDKKLGVNLMRWISPGGVIPFNGRK